MRWLNYASLLLLFLCTPLLAQTKKTSKLPKQLIGEWKGATKKGYIYEKWVPVNDTMMHAYSYFISGKDTTSSEQVDWICTGGQMYYNVSVAEQNKGETVSFKCSTPKQNLWVFTAPEHDFPQIITYKLINNTSMTACIADTSGKEICFPMNKIVDKK